MTDETTKVPDELAEQVTEEVTEEVVESPTGEQNQQQQAEDPWWKSRYRSPDEMAEDVRRFQSEADRYKRQMEELQSRLPQQQQPEQTSDEILDQLAKDPKGFIARVIEESVAPVKAQVAIAEFARKHPNFESYKEEMKQVVERNPAILNDPEGLDMVYNYVDTRRKANNVEKAAVKMQEHKDNVNQVKRTDAFVEGSTSPKRTQTPIIKEGMTPEEMDKALDEAGVGWITDEERHRF